MVSDIIQDLVRRVDEAQDADSNPQGKESVVEINKVVSLAATFYEKMRYLIEYKEEHTIRRSAVERILKRRILIEGKNVTADVLLHELAEGQYISQEEATATARFRADAILTRYMELWRLSGGSRSVGKWLLSFAAGEIDACFNLKRHAIDNGIVDALYQTVRPHIVAAGYTEDDINAQLLCACRRLLIGSDDAMLAYSLWLMHTKQWKEGTVTSNALASRVDSIIHTIEHDVEQQLQWQMVLKLKNEGIYFRIIHDLLVMRDDAAFILESKEEMEMYVRKFLADVYEKEGAKMRSSGLRATIYLLITKMAVALVAEVPYDMYMFGAVDYVPLAINAIFHPALLLALTRGASSFSDANTKTITDGMNALIYEGKQREIRIYTHYTAFTPIFAFLYIIIILGMFGAIVQLLQAFHFHLASTVLFLFFLALISYFTFRIRRNANRWHATGNETAFGVFTHILAAPIVRAGRWLSRSFSSINIAIIFMDFILETPFKLLLNFSSQFITYLKEKADEVY